MGDWIESDFCSRRTTRHFAWLPVRTFDAGWVWLKRYWVHERVWGWGFHDKFPYLKWDNVE